MGTEFRAVRRRASERVPLRRAFLGLRLEQGVAFDGVARPRLRIHRIAQCVHRSSASLSQRGHFEIPNVIAIPKVIIIKDWINLEHKRVKIMLFCLTHTQVLRRSEIRIHPRLEEALRLYSFKLAACNFHTCVCVTRPPSLSLFDGSGGDDDDIHEKSRFLVLSLWGS